MTRDELAARLFVVLAQEADHLNYETDTHNALAESAHKKVYSASALELADVLAKEAFDLADAFELERKRRLTEPEGEP